MKAGLGDYNNPKLLDRSHPPKVEMGLLNTVTLSFHDRKGHVSLNYDFVEGNRFCMATLGERRSRLLDFPEKTWTLDRCFNTSLNLMESCLDFQFQHTPFEI